MKQYLKKILMTLLLAFMLLAPTSPAHAGIYEIIKAAVVKVIKAVDLKIQRLQNKTIWLQNAQKELENAMSKLKLKEISEWTEKQRAQYDDYFKELWKVKNAISTWKKVKEIVQMQLRMVEEYKKAWSLLQRDKHFTPKELDYMFRVYSGMLEESLKNIDQLMLVASSFKTQMSDGKRMELINEAGSGLEKDLMDLRGFSDRNFRLSLSRAKDMKEAEDISRLYGIHP